MTTETKQSVLTEEVTREAFQRADVANPMCELTPWQIWRDSAIWAETYLTAELAERCSTGGPNDETLTAVYDLFGIGSLSRTPSTLMTCLGNVIRRAHCLSQVERVLSIPTPPEPGDCGIWGEESLLRWGAEPETYADHFRDALATYARYGAPQASTGALPDLQAKAISALRPFVDGFAGVRGHAEAAALLCELQAASAADGETHDAGDYVRGPMEVGAEESSKGVGEVSWEDVRDSLAMFLSGATGKPSSHWLEPLDDAASRGPLAKMRANLADSQRRNGKVGRGLLEVLRNFLERASDECRMGFGESTRTVKSADFDALAVAYRAAMVMSKQIDASDIDLRPHLRWALHRIATSLDTGDKYEAAHAALNASQGVLKSEMNGHAA